MSLSRYHNMYAGLMPILCLWLAGSSLNAQQTVGQVDFQWQTNTPSDMVGTDTLTATDTLATLRLCPPPDTVLPLTEILQCFSHETSLGELINKRLSYYKQHPTQGYSVLFFSASGNHSGAATEEAEELFHTLYPETPTYLSYDAPYYKLKAGNFRTRLEASAFLTQIQNEYPNAFVVREVLDIKHLLLLDLPLPKPQETTEGYEPLDATDETMGIIVPEAASPVAD